MPKDNKKKTVQQRYADKAKKRKTTSKDMPGSGMAKKAAKAMEKRNKQIDDALKKAMGQK